MHMHQQPNPRPASEPTGILSNVLKQLGPIEIQIAKHKVAHRIADEHLAALAAAPGIELPVPPELASRPVSQPRDLTREENLTAIRSIETEIGFPIARSYCTHRWESFKRDKENCLGLVLQVAEELKFRGASIDNFGDAVHDSRVDSLMGILHYIEFRKVAKVWREEVQRTIDALPAEQRIPFIVSEKWYLPLLKDAAGIEYAPGRDPKALIDLAKEKMGYAQAAEGTRNFWNRIEQSLASEPLVLLRLAQEICKREISLHKFMLASLYSGSSSLEANLYYADYQKIKDAEELARRQ